MMLTRAEGGGALRRAIPSLLILLAIGVHLPALGWWWLWDDPQLLLHALRVDTIDTLFEPSAYRALAAHTFTPLLPISFKIDLLIGGLNPVVAYAHQIAALLLAGLLLDQLLRRYVDRWVSVFSTVAFLSSWMGIYAARTLMIRHYLEGLVCALAALILWSGRSADGSRSRVGVAQEIAASIFWLLALLEKEIFAPLPLLLILQKRANGESWREVSKSLLAPAVAASIWLVWRWQMLGSFGGYATDASAGQMMSLPLLAARSLGGPALPLIGWTAVAVTLVVAFAAVIRRRSVVAATAVIAVVALAPLVTLTSNFEWRYAFGPAVAIFAGLALAIPVALENVRAQRLLAAVVAALMLIGSPFVASMYARIAEPVEEEGRWIWQRGPEAPGLVGRSPSWYLSGIRDLKNLDSSEGSPRFLASTEAFTIANLDPRRWVQWSAEEQSMVPIQTSAIQATRERRISPPPMTISMTRDGNLLSWSFESSDEVEWSIVTLPLFEVWPVPARGERRVPGTDDAGFFIVKLIWRDGRWTSSAELPFPADGETTRWIVR